MRYPGFAGTWPANPEDPGPRTPEKQHYYCNTEHGAAHRPPQRLVEPPRYDSDRVRMNIPSLFCCVLRAHETCAQSAKLTPNDPPPPNGAKLVSMAQEEAVRGRPWRGPLGSGRPACAVTEGLGPRHGWRLGLGSGLSCTVTHAARALMASVCRLCGPGSGLQGYSISAYGGASGLSLASGDLPLSCINLN